MILPLILGACAGQVRYRVESAFRAHNETSAELMLILPTLTDDAAIDRLEDAEARMDQACGPLDRAAIQQRDGQPIDARGAVLRAIDHCEHETAALRRLLDAGVPRH